MEFFFDASYSRSVSSANHKLQSDRPPMDTGDSGMSVYSASSTASPAKQSFADGRWGVKAFFHFIWVTDLIFLSFWTSPSLRYWKWEQSQSTTVTVSRDAGALFGILRQTHLLSWLPVDFCHLRCAAATTVNGLSIHRCYLYMKTFHATTTLYCSCSLQYSFR